MLIQDPAAVEILEETELYQRLLPLRSARIVELGCGTAVHTRKIAESNKPSSILACEIDSIQHQKNLKITDLPLVTFCHAGAQEIPVAEGSTDIVMMFKSLHHVPVQDMDRVMMEIRRILRPGGLAYISEPVFAGDFNEILRLFHNEQEVREAAFLAIKRAVEQGLLTLEGQYFFNTPRKFADFSEFEKRIIQVSHTSHSLSPDLHRKVQEQFERFMTSEGALFTIPIRVDLLQRPAD